MFHISEIDSDEEEEKELEAEVLAATKEELKVFKKKFGEKTGDQNNFFGRATFFLRPFFPSFYTGGGG